MQDFPVMFSASKPGYGLLIAVPTRSTKIEDENTVASVMTCVQQPRGCRVERRRLSGDGIFRMRNLAANSVLFNPELSWVTHLLFVDSDILFQPADVFKLMDSDCDFISGCYPKRQDKLEYVVNLYQGQGLSLNTGVQKAACLGTGFCLISRKCLAAITQALPRGYDGATLGRAEVVAQNPNSKKFPQIWSLLPWWFLPDDGSRQWWFDFFPMLALPDPDAGWVRQLSEDWIFSKLVAFAGIQPHIHTDVILRHAGAKVFGA